MLVNPAPCDPQATFDGDGCWLYYLYMPPQIFITASGLRLVFCPAYAKYE